MVIKNNKYPWNMYILVSDITQSGLSLQQWIFRLHKDTSNLYSNTTITSGLIISQFPIHMAACTYRVLAQSRYKHGSVLILMVTVPLEMGVSNGYPPEFYDLGVG